jgi:wyosine [tRNA(Phe)-imidazoG37] synthetase (radical SAM superfamily)
MALRPLKCGIVYGPINSKRLGRSLGINLLPPDKKVCSFDCVYCHYGRTLSAPFELAEPADVESELRKVLSGKPQIDFITFAGNGEPTVHPGFLEIVKRVKKVRDEMVPQVRIALLTNSSMLKRPDIAEACKLIDSPICKLDAGDEETFRRINRPIARTHLEDVVSGIKATPNATIQTIIVEGVSANTGEDHVGNIINAISKAQPVFVQVYSIDFPFPEGSIEPAANEKLERIAAMVKEKTGIDSKAYWEKK